MRTPVNSLTAILIAATALVGLSACSSDSTSTKATDTTTAASTQSSDTTASPDTTAAPDTAAASETSAPTAVADNLKPLLLTAAEVGPDFVEQPFSDPRGTTPCGIDVDGQYPSLGLNGTQLVQPEPLLALLEEIRVYDNAATAASAYALATAGFACDSAEGVTLADQTDLSDSFGVPAFGITVSSDQYQGAVILTQVNDAIVVFQFQAAKGADTSAAPNPQDIAQAGVDKIQQLLGG